MRPLSLISLAMLGWVALHCSSPGNIQEKTNFSHLDSLTDIYLGLHDSVLHSWNRVVRNEMDKSRILRHLADHLEGSQQVDKDALSLLYSRIDQLERIRFTQKTMANPYVVEEYDRACASLLEELIQQSATTRDLESTVVWIDEVQRATYFHRYYYDSLAQNFNQFVSSNGVTLKELGSSEALEKKPLFWDPAPRP